MGGRSCGSCSSAWRPSWSATPRRSRSCSSYVERRRSLWEGPKGDLAPAIYLTYDDGPNPEATPQLLDVLAREGASATFFVIPEFVTAETAPLVWRAVEEGHGVALHSGTRALMLKAPDDLATLLEVQADQIEALSGARPCRLFRPHAGWRGSQMYDGLDRAGYRLAGWGFAMWDFNWWRAPQPARLAARLAVRASDGSIVVMHDGHHRIPGPTACAPRRPPPRSSRC